MFCCCSVVHVLSSEQILSKSIVISFSLHSHELTVMSMDKAPWVRSARDRNLKLIETILILLCHLNDDGEFKLAYFSPISSRRACDLFNFIANCVSAFSTEETKEGSARVRAVRLIFEV